MGIPHELEDKEILEALTTQGITAAKRILKKVGGQLQKDYGHSGHLQKQNAGNNKFRL